MDELRAAEALLTTAEQVGVWGGSLVALLCLLPALC
jgi:hypothetical protein